MTELRQRRSAVRIRQEELNRRAATRADRFLCALCASAVNPIFDLRLLISALCALVLALSSFAEAQQPKKVPRIGFLVNTGPDAPNVEPFLKGLRDLGYIEGKNILIEYRYMVAPDQASKLVKELLQLKVDVFVSGASPAIRIAKEATSTTPIVMVIQQDPVALKLVDSFARPNGNLTGVTLLTRDLSGKRLELLKEVVPGVSRVGVLWATPTAVQTQGSPVLKNMKLRRAHSRYRCSR